MKFFIGLIVLFLIPFSMASVELIDPIGCGEDFLTNDACLFEKEEMLLFKIIDCSVEECPKEIFTVDSNGNVSFDGNIFFLIADINFSFSFRRMNFFKSMKFENLFFLSDYFAWQFNDCDFLFQCVPEYRMFEWDLGTYRGLRA